VLKKKFSFEKKNFRREEKKNFIKKKNFRREKKNFIKKKIFVIEKKKFIKKKIFVARKKKFLKKKIFFYHNVEIFSSSNKIFRRRNEKNVRNPIFSSTCINLSRHVIEVVTMSERHVDGTNTEFQTFYEIRQI
jgi:hypothetical protein